MPRMLSPVRLTGATTLRDGEMQDRSVVIENGRISKGPHPAVDLRGHYIMPGIIDLHGASLRHALRQGVDAVSAMRGTDRALAAQGVTTAWQMLDWATADHGPDTILGVLDLLDRYRPDALTDLRLQVCYDPVLPGAILPGAGSGLLSALHAYGLDLVLFPAQMDEARELTPQVVRHLCELAEQFDALGVSYGTLGDKTAERRERFAMIGARLSALPANRRPAAAAFAMGDPVVLSAQDILAGTYLQGNIPVSHLIRDRMTRALVSANAPAAPVRAAFDLVRSKSMGLPQAWDMVSAHPAQILRLSDRGVIDYGKRADLVVIHRETLQVEATICGGALTYLSKQAAPRFSVIQEPFRLDAE